MRLLRKSAIALITVLFFFSASIPNISAQTTSYSVTIDSFLNNKFPQIDTYVSVINEQGFPIMGLQKENFVIKEDGTENPEISVSSYSNVEEPLAFVLLIDTSGSMKGTKAPTPMDNVIAAAKDFVADLSQQDLLAVITFADEVNVLSELSSEKAKVSSSLGNLKADGNTAMNDAIIKAINILSNRSERKAIILLTDGEPHGEQTYTFDQALAQASISNIPFYPIGFGGVKENQLRQLAELTGGREQIKPDSLALSDAFESVLNIFREKYFITFASILPPDNQDHEIEIEVNFQGGTQSVQKNFIARDPVIVSIETPLEGETIRDMTKVVVHADCLNSLTNVDFFIDDQLLQTKAAPPFEFEWDTKEFVTGNHVIRVIANDEYGFSSEEIRNVIVELQRQDWIFWLIGLIILIGLSIFLSLGFRRKKSIPAAARKAILHEVDGLQVGREWPLDQEEIHLGRKLATNDIGLKGLSASRNHAILQRTREGYMISCLNSENPLIINGKTLEKATLKDGDVVSLGESTFRFEYRR